ANTYPANLVSGHVSDWYPFENNLTAICRIVMIYGVKKRGLARAIGTNEAK
ncbi:unnamed protein product, partial [marine sediment metagenome]